MNFVQLCKDKKQSLYFWKTARAQTDRWAWPTCSLCVVRLIQIFL